MNLRWPISAVTKAILVRKDNDDKWIPIEDSTPVRPEPPFARDAADRMRVVVDAATAPTNQYVTAYWGNVNVYPLYHSSGSPGSMDAREQQAVGAASALALNMQRWVFTP